MEWLIPSNSQIYDLDGAFKKFGFVDWGQGNKKYQIGDIIYLYTTKPIQQITHKCKVEKINLDSMSVVDDSQFYLDKSKFLDNHKNQFIRMRLIETFDSDLLGLNCLLANGLKSAPMGPMRINDTLRDYLELQLNKQNNIKSTKIDALIELITDNGGTANWSDIYTLIETYYPNAKQSSTWQEGLRGVLYRGIKQSLLVKLDTGLFATPDFVSNISDVKDVITANFDEAIEIREGNKISALVNKYERSSIARQKCLDTNGCYCHICGFDFENTYGEIGSGFIHVHHIVPLHKIDDGYIVDPINDLIPVCPNCHAMLHRKINGKYLSLNELKLILGK